ncbi:cbb3-type cytochrome c oxidase subunit I [Oceanobacillus halophilus]|uniref:Cytochrome C oxidase subunit I n=1 Tax=Oceanobacillus halophilus TaxID=930130 RepID=A0A495A4M7_9BACI|nr:cbb3-type cytochrome c oxidase subunit I [Oceanobacillus halophilus]RKQ34676.1 cytochrome C oxidase subunit I [Oceanobacillus halophilus]
MNSMVRKEERKANKHVASYLVIGGIVIGLMMIFGILMLLQQGGVFDVGPALFYQFLTIHGTGMVGAAALAAAAIMYYFLRQYVDLTPEIFVTNLWLFLVGVVMVIIGVFSFEYASAWTFLYPLPALSAGAWGTLGAILYLGGMLVLGTGFVLFYIDAGRAIIKKYGSLGKGLGWDILSGKRPVDKAPPKAVIASTMVIIVNTTALIAGTVVIIMNMIHVVNPAFTFDPLLAKNLTYAFGHIFANAIIYMGVIAVYEILPRYAKRKWGVSKAFLVAWNMSTFFTLLIYTHHLLMDPSMPKWALIMAQILSYSNGLPVLVITAYGALMLVYKSGIKWDLASGLAFLSMLGWTLGVVPAIVDATIVVNHVMHNTKWVPGHFHMYMGLGAVVMLFAFMYFLAKEDSGIKENWLDKFGLTCYTISFLGISGSFLVSGAISTPRRWATHIPDWMGPAVFGGVSGVLALLASTIFIFHFTRYMALRNKMGSESYEKKLA